jgi:hypothetical protein
MEKKSLRNFSPNPNPDSSSSSDDMSDERNDFTDRRRIFRR